MIPDSSDFIIKNIGTQGRKDKFFRTLCNSCNADRGYLLKTQDNRPTCNKCAKVGSTVPDRVKAKMSKSAYNRKTRKVKDIDGRSTRCISTYARDYGVSKEQVKLRHNFKTLINQKLKRRSIKKDLFLYGSLDYSIEDLKKHLESQFTEGMTWDNYGSWHIDHIVPDSWFNYKSMSDEQFKKSWSLSNLQPLWAEENLSKSNRFAGGGSFQHQ